MDNLSIFLLVAIVAITLFILSTRTFSPMRYQGSCSGCKSGGCPHANSNARMQCRSGMCPM